jgi:hypothetical protein
MKRLLVTLVSALAFGILAQSALAGGGTYTFAGGTPAEQATVHSALEASSFNWGLIPSTITVHIGAYGDSYSVYGNVYLDAALLDSGRFSWGVVQHEFAHQVDFFLFDDTKRAQLNALLGGKDWCYSVQGLKHSDYGCERFASELAWAYWPSSDNSMKPTSPNDEAGALPVAQFRTLLAGLIGAPSVAAAPSLAAAPAQTKAFAPVRAFAKPTAKPKHTAKPKLAAKPKR